jgi:hypothetical protein
VALMTSGFALVSEESGSAESRIEQTSDVDAPPCLPVDRGAMVVGVDPLVRFPGAPLQASSPAPIPSEEQAPVSHPATTVERRRRTAWADLLQRVFEVDALRCPACGGRTRILASITQPDVARPDPGMARHALAGSAAR